MVVAQASRLRFRTVDVSRRDTGSLFSRQRLRHRVSPAFNAHQNLSGNHGASRFLNPHLGRIRIRIRSRRSGS
jgi:hypothetical protein